MVGKFGHNLGNKRNREIFGPNWPKIITIVLISLLLAIFLYFMFNDGSEDAGEETVRQPSAEQAKTAEETAVSPGVTIIGECPLPTIPIVDITEETLYGDTTKDDQLSGECEGQVASAKRQLGKTFQTAKEAEAAVLAAEKQLGMAIAALDNALLEIAAQRDALTQARACTVQEDSDAEPEEAVEEDTAAAEETAEEDAEAASEEETEPEEATA